MTTSIGQSLNISHAEWQERINLAACYRLLALYGWDDVIYNHASVRVPGEPDMFLMKAHTLLYQEVTASNLVKVSMYADLDESSGVNRPGFTLHGGIYLARPDVHSAVHVHTQTGQAISILQCGLLMISQSAMRFYNRLGYHPYEGLTDAFTERPHRSKSRSTPRPHHGKSWGINRRYNCSREFYFAEISFRCCPNSITGSSKWPSTALHSRKYL